MNDVGVAREALREVDKGPDEVLRDQLRSSLFFVRRVDDHCGEALLVGFLLAGGLGFFFELRFPVLIFCHGIVPRLRFAREGTKESNADKPEV